MNRVHIILLVALILVFIIGLSIFFPQTMPREIPRKIKVTSVAFSNNEYIPVKYSKKGEDVSPPISWEPVDGAVCYALVMYDPDAPKGIFYHWILVNIPPNITQLPEGVPKAPKVKGLGTQCMNDYGYFGYGGPMPPSGEVHRYIFKVYALNSYIKIGEHCDRSIVKEIEAHAIAYGEIMGRYGG